MYELNNTRKDYLGAKKKKVAISARDYTANVCNNI